MKTPPRSIRNSPFVRILLMGFIVLLLQIPIGLLFGIISERQASRDEAVADITGTWGREQHLVGPILVVPYHQHHSELLADGRVKSWIVTEQAVFLPGALDVDVDATAETRYRGIYEVPVYRAEVQLKGSFPKVDFSGWDIAESDILWDKASVNLLVSDVRALSAASELAWGSRGVALEPGALFGDRPGVHASLSRSDLLASSASFSVDLKLNGSGRISAAPAGSQTEFSVASNWPDPSFGGDWLPQEKSPIESTGFTASWSVNLLGRNYPQRWAAGAEHLGSLVTSTMSVRFLSSVDPYRMSFRSVKYELLFLVLVFMTFWIFEVLSGVYLHPIQYLFCGVAMCVFYLLELSLSEHIGFLAAYTTAAGMVCALVVGYCRAVLKTRGRASIVGGVLSLLYAYLYMLLANQDFALLAGSVGLFAALALVMYLTRNVEWGGSTGEPTD